MRCRVACWREKGYQKLQYLQKEDGADNGLLQSLLLTFFNPITSFQHKWELTKWTANCWHRLCPSLFFFCPALPFSHCKRQTTQFQTISVSPKYNLSRAPSIKKKNTSLIIFPGCHGSYCVEKSPTNGILLFFHFTFYIKAKQYHDTIAWQKLVKERWGKSHRRMVSSQHNLDYYCKAYTSYYTAFNHNLNPKSLHIKLPGTSKKEKKKKRA